MNKSRFFLLGAAAAIPLILLVIIPHNAFACGWGLGPGGWGAGVGNGNDGWYHQGAYQLPGLQVIKQTIRQPPLCSITTII